MIIQENNVFTNDELSYFKNIIDNFIVDESPIFLKFIKRNDYFKQKITLNTNIENRIKTIIKKHISKEVIIDTVWLNMVDNNSNKNDDYHRDSTNMSFVIYPLKSFEGGELECVINNEVKNFEVEENSIVIMLHNIEHRVKPVIDGVRWSIAVFCNYDLKTKILI